MITSLLGRAACDEDRNDAQALLQREHRMRQLRRLGWSFDGLARHFALPPDEVRRVCDERALRLPPSGGAP